MAASVRHCIKNPLQLKSFLVDQVHGCLSYNQRRGIKKHFDPKFKQQRREKFLKVDLPAFDAVHKLLKNELTPAEIRAFMKERGIIPYRKHAPIVSLSDSGTLFDPYTPKEGDGVSSNISDVTTSVTKRGVRWKAVRDIRKLDPDFNIDAFPETAQQIYTEMHTLLTKVFPQNFLSEYRDDENLFKLHDAVTETGWPMVTNGLDNKTLIWRFVESIEAPRVVHVVCKDQKKADNKYAQITVRFHNKQVMALFDRFGRLMYGSESVPKDVLDFVVFEKHLSDSYGKWRVHGKVIPEWKTPMYEFRRTLIVPETPQKPSDNSKNKIQKEEENNAESEPGQSNIVTAV